MKRIFGLVIGLIFLLSVNMLIITAQEIKGLQLLKEFTDKNEFDRYKNSLLQPEIKLQEAKIVLKNDKELEFIDKDGKVVRTQFLQDKQSVEISQMGKYCFVQTSKAWNIHKIVLLNSSGNTLWEKDMGFFHKVYVSDDGSSVFVMGKFRLSPPVNVTHLEFYDISGKFISNFKLDSTENKFWEYGSWFFTKNGKKFIFFTLPSLSVSNRIEGKTIIYVYSSIGEQTCDYEVEGRIFRHMISATHTGNYLVFGVYCEQGHSLYVINERGYLIDKKVITKGANISFYVSISEDGKYVYYESDKDYRIYNNLNLE